MEMKIIEKEALPLPRLNKMISDLAKKADAIDIQKKIQIISKKYSKISEASAEKLEKELLELGIPGMGKDMIAQLITIMPAELSELRILFAGAKVPIAPENFNKILDLILKYRKK